MNMDFMFTLISVLISISTFFLGRFTKIKNEGMESGKLLSDIQYIKEALKEMIQENKDLNINIIKLSEKIIFLEESTKAAHKKIIDNKKEFNDIKENYYCK